MTEGQQPTTVPAETGKPASAGQTQSADQSTAKVDASPRVAREHELPGRSALTDIWDKRNQQIANEIKEGTDPSFGGFEPFSEGDQDGDAAAGKEGAAAPAEGKGGSPEQSAAEDGAGAGRSAAGDADGSAPSGGTGDRTAPAADANTTGTQDFVDIRLADGRNARVPADQLVGLARAGLEAATGDRRPPQPQGDGQPPKGGKPGDQPGTRASGEPADHLAGVDLNETVDAIDLGDKEKAAEKLGEALRTVAENVAKSVKIDTNRVVERATFETWASTQIDSDLSAFNVDFKDIAEDPALSQITALRVNQLRAENLVRLGYRQDQVNGLTPERLMQLHLREQYQGRLPANREVFAAAAEGTREWMKSKTGGKTAVDGKANGGGNRTTQPSPLSNGQRRAAKAEAPQPIKGGGSPRAADAGIPDVEKTIEASRRSAFSDIRKARGQDTAPFAG